MDDEKSQDIYQNDTFDSANLHMPHRLRKINSSDAPVWGGWCCRHRNVPLRWPASAEKKEITEPEEIADVYSTFSNLKVTDKETEPLTGSTVTSFRFRLLDGTSYEIIYNAEGVKSGRVQLGEETKDYFTSADIGSLWENCQEEAVKVDEAELPAYPWFTETKSAVRLEEIPLGGWSCFMRLRVHFYRGYGKIMT